MTSVTSAELELVHECIKKTAKKRPVRAACLYGSRVAGYARRGSDIDVLIVLERFPFGVIYDYYRDRRGDVSALIVGSAAFQKDAERGMLGEFVIGRLLHVYQPLEGAGYLAEIERIYKKRVILEEVKDLVASTGTLCSELMFPLEFIHFSKIKRRAVYYPSAAYSFYKTYSPSPYLAANIESALIGYRRALDSIESEDPGLFVKIGALLEISENRISVERSAMRLRLSKRLQQLGSYLIHTYAGINVMHRSVGEAKSKIRRRVQTRLQVPRSISDPKSEYCKLPEGLLISGESGNWLNDYARNKGIGDYFVSRRQRLGNSSSRTVLYCLSLSDSVGKARASNERKIVVKEIGIAKSMKWSALNVWTASVKRYSVDPLFLIGSEYRGLRYMRQIGLKSPNIEAVVLGRRLIVTNFLPGKTMADITRGFLRDRSGSFFVALVGEQIAKVHSLGSSFGNIKPKNIIESNGGLFFTDLAQFAIKSEGEQPWDVAQFVSWALKRTSNVEAAKEFVVRFLEGYQSVSGNPQRVISNLAKSRRHLESFYPVLTPQVARVIRQEIRKAAGTGRVSPGTL